MGWIGANTELSCPRIDIEIPNDEGWIDVTVGPMTTPPGTRTRVEVFGLLTPNAIT